MFFSDSALLTFTFEIDPNDIIDARCQIDKSPRQRKRELIGMAILLGGATCCFIAFLISEDEDILAASACVFLIAFISCLYEQQKKVIRTNAEKHHAKLHPGGIGLGALLGERTFSIYSEGVSLQTKNSLEHHKWNTLSAIFLLPDSILIFTTPTTFHQLPIDKIGKENLKKATELLHKNSPANLIRTKYDYPLQ